MNDSCVRPKSLSIVEDGTLGGVCFQVTERWGTG